MKRFIFVVIAFFAAIFLIDKGLSQVLSTIVDKSNFRFSRVSRLDENTVVVLGNSRGVNSVNEKYCHDSLNVDLINLSYNGMTPSLIIGLSQDLSKNTVFDNSIFLIEISSFFAWEEIKNGINCNEGNFFLQNRDFPDFFLPFRGNFKTVDSIYDLKYPMNSVFNLLDYNSEGLLRSIYYLRKSDNEWINNGVISSSLIDYYDHLHCIKLTFDRTGFEDLLEALKKYNVKYRFFMAPWHESYKNKFVNYNLILNLIKDKYRVNIVRLDNLELQSSFFADGLHTNTNIDRFLTRSLIDSTLSSKN